MTLYDSFSDMKYPFQIRHDSDSQILLFCEIELLVFVEGEEHSDFCNTW